MPSLTLAYDEGATPQKWIRIWAERRPDAQLVHRMADGAAVDAVRDGSADIAIVRLPIDTEELHLIRLYEEQPVVVVAKDHAVADAESVTLADIDGELLDTTGLSFEQRIEVAATGAGVVIVPMSIARLHARKDAKSIPVTDAPTTEIGIAWPVDGGGDLVDELIGIVRGRTANSSRRPVAEPEPAPERKKAKQPQKPQAKRKIEQQPGRTRPKRGPRSRRRS